MNTISFKISKTNEKFLQNYLMHNELNINQFINQLIEEKKEDEEDLDEEELLKEIKNAKTDKKYTHEEVWKILGI